MNYYPFDSRNSIYREKIGALAEGETLRLKVLLHKAAQVHNVYLMWQNDADGSVTETEMMAGDWLEDYRYYLCDVELHEGLYWYGFRYTSNFGEFFVIKTEDSLGIVSATRGALWQQTVYSKDYNTPDWLDGGIIYQIFPDRFAKSGEEKKNVPSDRFICEDWGRQPEFRQIKGEKCCLGNDYYGGDLFGIEQKLDYILIDNESFNLLKNKGKSLVTNTKNSFKAIYFPVCDFAAEKIEEKIIKLAENGAVIYLENSNFITERLRSTSGIIIVENANVAAKTLYTQKLNDIEVNMNKLQNLTYCHKEINGKEVYMFVNNVNDITTATITLKETKDPCFYNLIKQKKTSVKHTKTNKTITFNLKLEPYGVIFAVFE